MTAQTYIRQSHQTVKRWITLARTHWAFQGALWCLAGFLASAASLGNVPLPLPMGLVCALSGWQAAAAAAGSLLGYGVFWHTAGYSGMVWTGIALLLRLTLGHRTEKTAPLLLGAVCGFTVSFTGLIFQWLRLEDISFGLYALRIGVAMGSVWLFPRAAKGDDPIFQWLAESAAMLALAQVAPLPWLSLGYVAAGLLAAKEALPGVALTGLALDIAGVTGVPMTAALSLGFLARLLPNAGRWVKCAAPGVSYLLVMTLSGSVDLTPLPGLLAGGLLSLALPGRQEAPPRRGETGLAQVRLELMAGALSQTQQLLLEAPPPMIDTQALLARTRERACGGCPNRKQCRDVEIPEDALSRSFTEAAELGFPCKKPGRMVLELRRSQEQLRALRADGLRREQYRDAAAQQYQFLAEFLRQQADELPRRGEKLRPRYQAEVGVCTAGKEAANGDKCMWFSGTRCRYYILLCDGMGTGLGAEQEGRTAADMLRQMLTAGFPAEYALRSLNSLCVLRSSAGAVTVDLAEICLSTGNVTVYKWGAAPSWLLRRTGAEKIGTAGPPPGLSVTQSRETVERLSLRRGEALILTSDGVDGEGVLRRLRIDPAEPPGEVAALLVEHGAAQVADDATAAVIRLRSVTLRAS